MTRPRIILADDDKDFCAMLRAVLAEAGYDVQTAANGVEALRLCETHSPAAAIVDLIMPQKEGLETIFEMRRLFPHIKAIAISGSGRGPRDTYLEMARHLGAAAALAKPFALADLLRTLDQVLLPDSSSTDDKPSAGT